MSKREGRKRSTWPDDLPRISEKIDSLRVTQRQNK